MLGMASPPPQLGNERYHFPHQWWQERICLGCARKYTESEILVMSDIISALMLLISHITSADLLMNKRAMITGTSNRKWQGVGELHTWQIIKLDEISIIQSGNCSSERWQAQTHINQPSMHPSFVDPRYGISSTTKYRRWNFWPVHDALHICKIDSHQHVVPESEIVAFFMWIGPRYEELW